MSGTKAHAKRKQDKQQAEIIRLTTLNDNRTSLHNATIAELTALYGEENVNASHPLFAAIQASANGSFIDLEQLATDITTFKVQEAE